MTNHYQFTEAMKFIKNTRSEPGNELAHFPEIMNENGETALIMYMKKHLRVPIGDGIWMIYPPFDKVSEIFPAPPDNDETSCRICRLSKIEIDKYKTIKTKNSAFRVYECGHCIYQPKTKNNQKARFFNKNDPIANEFIEFTKLSKQNKITEKDVRNVLRYCGYQRVSKEIIDKFIKNRDACYLSNILHGKATEIYEDGKLVNTIT